MRSWIAVFLGLGSSLFAVAVPQNELMPAYKTKQEPWFTGPLISPSGNNMPAGMINLEPYLFATHSSSFYDEDWKKIDSGASAWDLNVLVILQVGITRWLDFTLVPSWFFALTNGSKSFSLGDFSAAIGFQLLKQSPNSWYPSIRLVLDEIFPIGRFENLDPEQFGTDAAGAGSYVTSVLLGASWKVHLWDIHWANIRLAAAHNFAAKVRVHGHSAYGGTFDTNGWVYPGQGTQLLFGLEFNLTQRWVLAYDAVANFNTSIHFKGFPGFDEITNLPADLNEGASTQFSMAPALEYNWTSHLGLISGVWFTFAGRNAEAFTSWVTALNYFY